MAGSAPSDTHGCWPLLTNDPALAIAMLCVGLEGRTSRGKHVRRREQKTDEDKKKQNTSKATSVKYTRRKAIRMTEDIL